MKEVPGKVSQEVDVRLLIEPFWKATKEVHVDQKLSEGRGLRNTYVSTADSSRGGV